MVQLKQIGLELKHHAPFTAFGAGTGVVIMGVMAWLGISSNISDIGFHVLHPLHILLSAFVTASMYILYRGKTLAALPIGFIGAIGICSLSDIVLPYMGGVLIGVKIEWHVCFIEHPQIIIPLALIGIACAYLRPTTKFPHAGHVLVSTWASLFYLLAFGVAVWTPLLPFVFLLLFAAVWVPCCVSDIVFPLLFVKGL